MNREVIGGPPEGVYGRDESIVYSMKKRGAKAIDTVRRRVSDAFTSRKKLEAALEKTRYKFDEDAEAPGRRDSWAS